jgi:hypothetical protein
MKTMIGLGVSLIVCLCVAALLIPVAMLVLLAVGVPLVFAAIVLCVVCSGLAAIVFWLWMLVDAIQNKGLRDGEKAGWVIAIALLHVLAAIAYFIFGHPKRNAPLNFAS